MKQTIAEGILRKFERLTDGLIAAEMPRPSWLNSAMEVLESNRGLDDWEEIKSAWFAEKETRDNWMEILVQANALWKIARVHPMFK